MDFVISDFEGPLDVLLTLIKDNKMDICDIPIIELTDQYMNFINSMENLDLSIASDYLVMASELMYLKSKALVPNAKEDEEFNEAKEDLINRLIEYQKYKEVTKDLELLEEKRKELFSKDPSSFKNFASDKISLESDITLEDLALALKRFMERKNYEQPVSTKITTKEYSVEERIKSIKNILKQKRKIEFFELFETFSKPYIIVTFLSILELAKKNEIKITQEGNFDKIYCEEI